jgi:hypothetical protein
LQAGALGAEGSPKNARPATGATKHSIYFVAARFIMRKTTTACKTDERKRIPPQDGPSRMQGRDKTQGGFPCTF